MSHSEKAVLLSELYAIRSSAAATHQTACRERLMLVATFAAAARDSMTEAINSLETELKTERKERDAQRTFFPENP